MKVIAFAALFASAVSAELCDIAELTTKFTPIFPVVTKCSEKSGYNLFPPNALPTPAEQKVLCTCTELIEQVSGMELPTCEIPMGESLISVKKFFDSVTGSCGAEGAASSADPTVGAANATETAVAGAVTMAPGAESDDDAEGSMESTESGSDKDTDAEVVTAPEASSAAPTAAPTKKSAAVANAVSAVAVVAASVAALAL